MLFKKDTAKYIKAHPDQFDGINGNDIKDIDANIRFDESVVTEGSIDSKSFKQFWDKGPKTKIRKTFGKDYDKSLDNRINLLLTIVKDPDDAEKYSEMDFLHLPDGISSQLMNMDQKEIDRILESSVTEGQVEPQIMKIAELTGEHPKKVEEYVSSRALNVTSLLQHIKDDKQVIIREFRKAIKGDKDADAMFIFLHKA